MTRTRLIPRAVVALLAIAVPIAAEARQAAPAAESACSRAWIGHETEIEAFMTSGKVTRVEAVPIGVTRPGGRARPTHRVPVGDARCLWRNDLLDDR